MIGEKQLFSQNTRLSTWRSLLPISFGNDGMSSPENATAASGEDQRGKDSDMKNLSVPLPVSPHDDLPSSSHDDLHSSSCEDLHYSSCHDDLHSSSQETTPRPVNHKVFQNEVNSRKLKVFLRDFQHSDDFEDQFKDEAESENDGTLRKTSSFFLKQKSSSEDEELAGPSHPALQDDSTRVPLGENKDYINASYIKIANSREEYYYIATQGPLPTTTNDFWQMVWENNSNVIAMITKEKEGGVTKCHHYWPISMKKPLELNSCRIFLENYQILRYFIIRMFQVVKKSTGASHFVKHLQFTNWPDHGTPASAEGFIKYVRYVRKSHLTGPVVVHCSAGVGRTGVFLCVDVVFCAIEKNFSFDIMNIVSQMREQRHGMVQTKEQYMFCYKIVLEVLQKLWTVK
ncbi:tyrosine-protein phosphatase non-receptor type 20 isoform X2 [Bos indicus x Bos taurus]|uniref:tyrosine-protein phosphatase non-receptor type 20 isoform X2 n=1 Tax=Bos indicus x Bos taurus TaxID=30522 RepID=UPI000F7D1609|nr:tyrosine-protein phosphatase non-receptor type 20 isoform X2 [Bos indicus x Bos taurus]